MINIQTAARTGVVETFRQPQYRKRGGVMRRNNILRNLMVFLTMLFVIGSAQTFAQRKVAKKRPVLRRATTKRPVAVAPKMFSIASGTRLRARMNEEISSKTATVGQHFAANVTEPVYSTNGVLVIPAGSTVTGRIDSVTR